MSEQLAFMTDTLEFDDHSWGLEPAVMLFELEKTVKLLKKSPAQDYALALVNILRKDIDAAQVHLQSLVEKLPNSNFAQRRMGQLLIMREEYEAAVPHFEKAIALNPVDYTSKIWLCLLYYRLKLDDKAQDLIHSLEDSVFHLYLSRDCLSASISS